MMRAVLVTVALASEPFLSEESHQQAFQKFMKDFEKAYGVLTDFLCVYGQRDVA